MSIDRRGNIEVRTNEDGSLDEIVLYDDAGECLFHLEQMSDDCYWMRIEGKPALTCNVFTKRRKIAANFEWEPT